MRKLNKAQQAAAEAADQALEHGSKTIEDVIDYVVPRARHAYDQAESFLVPAYKDAKGRIVPLARDVRERVQPAVQDAYETVSERFMHDVYPRLTDAWEHAQEDPRVAEASRRSRSALAALRGDLVLPDRQLPEPVRRGGGVVRKILAGLGIAALIGALVVAVRTVLGSSDDGWSPAEPLRPVDEDDADWGENPFAPDDQIDVDPDVHSTATTSLAEAEDVMVAEGGPTVDAPADEAPAYGEGAYVGAEPPEGYTIKGNERSMKYHTVEAAGYDRTNADVWFNSEEAAQSAGFTRALR